MRRLLTLAFLLPILATADALPPARSAPTTAEGSGISAPPQRIDQPARKPLPSNVTALSGAKYPTAPDECARSYALRLMPSDKTTAPLLVGVVLDRGRVPGCLQQAYSASFEIARDGQIFVPLKDAPYVREPSETGSARLWQALLTLPEKGQYQLRVRIESGTSGVLVGPLSVSAD